jgi:DNA-binding NarL/FixJ family response regulator
MVRRNAGAHNDGMKKLFSTTHNNVFIVEDSAAIRTRLVALLREIDGVSIAGEADTAQAAVEGILRTRPQTVVLDLHLQGGASGIDVLRATHAKAPETVFIVLTSHADPLYRRICMDAGASYFFDKTTEIGKLRETVAKLGARH